MWDKVTESILFAFTIVLLGYIWWKTRKEGFHNERGFRFVIVAALFLCLSVAIDLTDNFSSADKLVVLGDTDTALYLKRTGYLIGIISFMFGVVRWLPLASLGKQVQERKEAAQALEESEELYRSLVENAPLGIGIAGADGKLIAYNEAMLTPGGYSREDIERIGNVAHLYFDNDQRAEALGIFGKQGFLHRHEVRFKRKDGTPYEALLSLTQIHIKGEPCLQAVVEDVTERKRADQELKESEERFRQLEERFRQLIEQAGEGFFLHDKEGKFIMVNRRACEVLGYAHDQLMSLSVTDVEKNFSFGELSEAWENIASGEPATLEGVHERSDGTRFPVEVRVGKLEYQGQEVFLALARDITSRKEVEDALRESGERWQSLAENAPFFMINVDKDGTILYINRTFPNTSVKQVTGTSLYAFVPPEGADHFRSSLETVFEGKQAPIYESEGEALDGGSEWFEVRMGPIKKQGEVVAAAIIATDITERKNAEAALYESEERWRSIADNAPFFMINVDRDGTILYINRTVPPYES